MTIGPGPGATPANGGIEPGIAPSVPSEGFAGSAGASIGTAEASIVTVPWEGAVPAATVAPVVSIVPVAGLVRGNAASVAAAAAIRRAVRSRCMVPPQSDGSAGPSTDPSLGSLRVTANAAAGPRDRTRTALRAIPGAGRERLQ